MKTTTKIIRIGMLWAFAMLLQDIFATTNVTTTVRAKLDDLTSTLPPKSNQREYVEEMMSFGSFHARPVYESLAEVVSNDWREVLSNLGCIATNDSERLLILGVGTHYTEDFYLGFLDVLCDMRTNNAITVRELHDAMASHRADIDSCLARRYQETNVVALLNKLKIADGDSAGWDYYLSGMAYTNYIDMVGSGAIP